MDDYSLETRALRKSSRRSAGRHANPNRFPCAHRSKKTVAAEGQVSQGVHATIAQMLFKPVVTELNIWMSNWQLGSAEQRQLYDSGATSSRRHQHNATEWNTVFHLFNINTMRLGGTPYSVPPLLLPTIGQ